jgi:ADP-heptose:LPS heptosyltransferase
VGPGAGEVARFAALDDPTLAGWLAGGRPEDDVADLRADVILAVTRSQDLLARLRGLAHRVLERDPSPGRGSHASLWYAEPLRALGADPTPSPPLLEFTAEERRKAAEWACRLPEGFLAVHPGSGSPTKNWPADRYAQLVRVRGDGTHWLLVSGPADTGVVCPLVALPGAVHARDLPPRVLGALLARAGLYVGNDSGVTHLAAAAGAPTLALFGPTDAATWTPVGPLVETVSSPDGSMEGLDLARVRVAAAHLLARVSRR